MPWKTTDDGSIEVRDGAPVWVTDAGKEIAYDPAETHRRLSGERSRAGNLEQQLTEARERLAALEWAGDDPEATRKELTRLQALERKAKRKGGKAGENGDEDADLDKLHEELHASKSAVESLTKKLEEAQKAAEAERQTALQMVRRNTFRASKLYSNWYDDEGEKRDPETTMDPGAAEALFGSHVFPGTNGKPVVVMRPEDGTKPANIIMSTEQDGKPASVDEALKILFHGWEGHTHYLRKSQPGSAGAGESGGGGDGKRMTRAQFEKLSHPERATFHKEGGTVV